MDGICDISRFISTMDGIGYIVPREISDGPKIYPDPFVIPPVMVKKSCNCGGIIAARIPCNNVLAIAVSRIVRPGAISIPLDFTVDKNSSRVICCVSLVYSMPRPAAIWAATWARRSSVALPPVPPPAVWAGIYIFFAGFGIHIVSYPAWPIINLSMF